MGKTQIGAFDGFDMADWTAAQEEELRQAKQTAGWRWIAYFLTVVGLAVVFTGTAIITSISPGDPKGALQVSWILGGMILLLAIVLDIPAEKAAKRAKVLAAQKSDAGQA